MWEVMVKGGITMIPLGLCSIIALAVIIERLINLRRKKIIHPEIVTVIDSINGPEDVHLALLLCKKEDGTFANIIRTGLENMDISHEAFREAIADQGRQEMHALEKGLLALEIVAGIAPLLGLLGTVLGMIHIFDVVTVEGMGGAKNISAGIAEALITTVAGLCIAIPTLVFYHVFVKKAENYVMEIEKYSNKLITKFQKFQTVNNQSS